jgi:hypothetical protein
LLDRGNFAVLRVEVDVGGFKIIDYQPLPIATSRKYMGLEGSSEIIYSNQGVDPKPSRPIYRLRNSKY